VLDGGVKRNCALEVGRTLNMLFRSQSAPYFVVRTLQLRKVYIGLEELFWLIKNDCSIHGNTT
jgi:hypothetical protein